MIQKGTKVKSESGLMIRFEQFITAGGQGEVHEVTRLSGGELGVVKAFFPAFVNPQTAERIHFLVKAQLAKACPVLQGPTDGIHEGSLLGHYTPKCPGLALEDLMMNTSYTLVDGLQIAVAIARALAVLAQRQIAHGDIHSANVLIHKNGGVYEVYLIDFDNFNAPGLPLPPMIGQNLYLAPELREAMTQARPAVPDLLSDRFSLGVLLHEVLLLRHVAAGWDGDEESFRKAMCSGSWLNDPVYGGVPGSAAGGYPTQILNPELANLFRRAMSLGRQERPAPDEWEKALVKAMNAIPICPSCGNGFLTDSSKTVCPVCGKPFPTLKLNIKGGRQIALDRAMVVVGRSELNGSVKASSRHAIFRKVGPETLIESIGLNGSFRKAGAQWIKLPEGRPILVQKGDILRLGDVEVSLN